MKNHQYYMEIAILAAKEAKKEHGVAIGAVIVNETGDVIASSGSLAGPTSDPTAHAEVNCIRIAAENIDSPDLKSCTLYSTLESCHMCLSAAAWAKIPEIYFGAYKKDVSDRFFDIKGQYSSEDEARKMNLRDGETMHVQGGILERECAELLSE